MISIFAALNGSILSGARVPYAMARDKFFFKALGRVHERYVTPHVAILTQSSWGGPAGALRTLRTTIHVRHFRKLDSLRNDGPRPFFVLRSKRPEMKRPYRTLGYPIVPALFVFMAGSLVVMTLFKSPRESLTGLLLVALGFPFYKFWKKRATLFSSSSFLRHK